MPGGTAHAPPNLMELGQPQPIRVLDDQGVNVGNINACLNDRRADQNLNFPV